jgi:hypothetical protein
VTPQVSIICPPHSSIPDTEDLVANPNVGFYCHSWGTVLKELRKCVLLCANCHAEAHADIHSLNK